MKGALTASTLMHGLVLAGLALGLPRGPREDSPPPVLLPVEIVDIAESAAVPERAPAEATTPEPVPPRDEAGAPAPAPAAKPTPAPAEPEPSADLAPDPAPSALEAPRLGREVARPRLPERLAAPELAALSEPEPTPEPVSEPEPTPPPEPAPALDTAAAAPPRPAPAPPAKPVPPETPETPETVAPEPPATPARDPLDSVLRDLASAPEDRPAGGEAMAAPDSASEEAVPVPPEAGVKLAAELSEPELAALRRQFREERCWNYNAAGKGMAERVVHIRLTLERDRTVARIAILNDPEELADPAFRALAESARRAVLICQPLRLPEGKYARWREMILHFRPKDMI